MGKQTAEKKEALDLKSGREIIDWEGGVYVAVRIKGRAQRALRNFANERGVKMTDLLATALLSTYGDILNQSEHS